MLYVCFASVRPEDWPRAVNVLNRQKGRVALDNRRGRAKTVHAKIAGIIPAVTNCIAVTGAPAVGEAVGDCAHELFIIRLDDNARQLPVLAPWPQYLFPGRPWPTVRPADCPGCNR